MNKCSNPDHPHCTLWVMPGAQACANGHAQAAEPSVPLAADTGSSAPSTYDMLSAIRSARPPAGGMAFTLPSVAPARSAPAAAIPADTGTAQPHLHISGFDPRAAGGRQTIKVELRGMPEGCCSLLTMHLQSALIPGGVARHTLVRTLRGDWRALFVEFSSRDKEHGQYRIDVELFSQNDGRVDRKWVSTMVILVPRPDASLTDIHQTFLATHKNVRVMADDASIARVNAHTAGRLDIDVHARNASIANLELDGRTGKVDLGMSTIAWDEDLVEIDLPPHSAAHPFPSIAACLVNPAPEPGYQRQVRLFALDECLLGRFELYDPEADLLLTHFGDDGQDRNGLTRRLSGRHAIVRRALHGWEIEDVSRYGLLVDGVWPGKHKPVPLRLGMRIELTASIRGIVALGVTGLLPHGVVLHRIDQGAQAECFMLLEPNRYPGFPLPEGLQTPLASVLPLVFHQQGGFWHLDPQTGKTTALEPGVPLDRLAQMPAQARFASDPYPECWVVRSMLKSVHPSVISDMYTA